MSTCCFCFITERVDSVVNSVFAAVIFTGLTFAFVLTWSFFCKRFQWIRAWTWWLRIRMFSNRFNSIKTGPIKSFNVFYKNVVKAIDIVSEMLGISRTNQNSPPGMPLAIASIEFYEYVMDVIWLLANRDADNGVAEDVYTKITQKYEYCSGEAYYQTDENKKLFDKDWKIPLNVSFENQNHYLMTYQEFTTIFTSSLNKIG